MNVELREILTNLKAAVRIGHPETIELALYALRSLPQVASNRPLKPSFLNETVLPLSRVLATAPRLPDLSSDRLAAIRALGAGALAFRFLEGKRASPADLLIPARDPRPEVRMALRQALTLAGSPYPSKLLTLTESWLNDPSPRVRQLALELVPSLAAEHGERLLDAIQSLHREEHPQVRAALVDALTALAEAGLAEPILGRLAAWAGEPSPNFWVVARVLSTSWAAEHLQQAENILSTLERQTGPNRQIANARRALERHCAG
jgi:hypothetical protein